MFLSNTTTATATTTKLDHPDEQGDGRCALVRTSKCLYTASLFPRSGWFRGLSRDVSSVWRAVAKKNNKEVEETRENLVCRALEPAHRVTVGKLV